MKKLEGACMVLCAFIYMYIIYISIYIQYTICKFKECECSLYIPMSLSLFHVLLFFIPMSISLPPESRPFDSQFASNLDFVLLPPPHHLLFLTVFSFLVFSLLSHSLRTTKTFFSSCVFSLLSLLVDLYSPRRFTLTLSLSLSLSLFVATDAPMKRRSTRNT